MASHNRVGDDRGNFRRRAAALFNLLEGLRAQCQTSTCPRPETESYAGIEVPARNSQTTAARRGGQAMRISSSDSRFDLSEPQHYVRHLHARVVNVIFHLHAPPSVTE